MSAPQQLIGWQRIAVLTAIGLFSAMFAIAGSMSARSPAAWVGRIGSIIVIAGVVLNHRAFAAIIGRAPDEGLPPLTCILIVVGITAIIGGFVLGTVGF